MTARELHTLLTDLVSVAPNARIMMLVEISNATGQSEVTPIDIESLRQPPPGVDFGEQVIFLTAIPAGEK